MTIVNIASRLVGDGQPCFIIAEAGVNHNGDVNLAKKLIEVAVAAGADAVKFQTYRTGNLVVRGTEKAAYQKESSGANESQFEMLEKLELRDRDFADLFAYAGAKKIIFLSTPFDKESVDLLDKLGVPAFKIGSGEITDFPLLKHIAGKRKPVILSTGMAVVEEIEEALQVLKAEGARDIVLLHCVSSYPARVEDMNLKAMGTLRSIFKLPTGLSDHSPGIIVPVAAVALEACVIEKHFTLDRSLPGPDHRTSLEPDELKQMVKAIRDVEKAMGDGTKQPTADEAKNKKLARRVIVARVDIQKGDIITGEMLDVKRAGTGIEPGYLDMAVGKRAARDIKREGTITWDSLE
jgi:N,N'-diacetyllegionaminate synthase